MKINVLRLLTALLVILALALPAVAGTPKSPAGKAAPTASAPPSGTAAADPDERHPQIRAALASLRNAREHLNHAAHDFGGHRVEAIKAIDEAIRQLEVCLQYDKD